jgi:hypothetical protein
MMKWIKTCGVGIALVAPMAAAGPVPVALEIAGRASANASIAASGDFVVVVWGAATTSGSTEIYAATSRDGGATFAAPVRASGGRADAQISGEQPPRVTLARRPSGEPSVVVVWTVRGTTGTRLVAARSDSGSRSFGAVTTVPGTDAPGNRGWEAITTRPDGTVVAAWLDHRETVSDGTSAAHMHHDGQAPVGGAAATDSTARAQLSKLYVGDVDGTTEPQAVTGGVCYCCKTALDAGTDGTLYAAWRHVYAGNLRDIAFALSRDGGRTFAPTVRVSEDRWALDGCPENGPAIAVDSRKRIHLVWPTLVPASAAGGEPTLGLFYAASDDGRRFSPRQRIPAQGTPYHPQIAVSGRGTLLIAWDELADGQRRIAVGRAGATVPGLGFTREQVSTAARGSYPVVAATAGGFALAWTDLSHMPSRIVVQRVP